MFFREVIKDCVKERLVRNILTDLKINEKVEVIGNLENGTIKFSMTKKYEEIR